MFNVEPMQLNALLRLIAALILGGIIGSERANKKHDAGLRTHILVCVASALVMVISEQLVSYYKLNSDIMRMGAQVISGIGFLGMGCIITEGDRIKGLTTAAGLWATACVGLAVGSGFYIIALTVVAIMLFTMFVLRPVTLWLQRGDTSQTILIALKERSKMSELIIYLNGLGIETVSIKIDNTDYSSGVHIIFETQIKKPLEKEELIGKIASFDEVEQVSFL